CSLYDSASSQRYTLSLHDALPIFSPQIITMYPDFGGSILIRTDADKTIEILAGLQKLSHQINPNHPFHYDFLDDAFQNRYKSEIDRKSTRLNSSHVKLSYAVFCLK